MPKFLVGRGTLLNTATVVAGSLAGLLLGRVLPPALQATVLSALGLITVGMGVKLFLDSKNVPLLSAAMALGAILGTLIGLQSGMNAFGEWAKQTFGGQGSATFTEAVVTASILFCVGPMTLMGCLQEALENKIDLLAVKSTLDGFAALFLTVALGEGVLVSAIVVLVGQGALTLLGTSLRRVAEEAETMREAAAVGGPILMAIGLGLLGLTDLPVADYLPALVLSPLFVWLARKRVRPQAEACGPDAD